MSSPSSGNSAIPIDASTTSGSPCTPIGSSSAWTRRSTAATTSACPLGVGSRTPNSSPPLRATGSGLAPADARDRVGAAQRAGQPAGDLAQQLVPGVVAERVVDLLEAVHVHDHH